MQSFIIENNNNIEYVHKKFRKRKRESINSLSDNHSLNSSNVSDIESSVESDDLCAPIHKKFKLDLQNETSSLLKLTSSSTPPLVAVEGLDQLSDIYHYHTNMIRTHPQKERNSEEQKRRDKNTVACWFSRRRKKLRDLMVAKEYEDNLKRYDLILKETVRAACYMQCLFKALGKENENYVELK